MFRNFFGDHKTTQATNTLQGYLRASNQIEAINQQLEDAVNTAILQGTAPWDAYTAVGYALAFVRACRCHVIVVQAIVQAPPPNSPLPRDAYDQEAGGLRTVLFSGNRPGRDIGDLNPENLQAKWNAIQWVGDTWIVPGFNALLQAYKSEFGSRPPQERPTLRALIITDGEAKDADQFDALLERVSGNMYVIIATVGHGHDHDRAVAAYQAIAQRNAHLKVVNLSGADPETISKTLLAMIAD